MQIYINTAHNQYYQEWANNMFFKEKFLNKVSKCAR